MTAILNGNPQDGCLSLAENFQSNKCEWDNFQQFLETIQELRIVQLNQDNWKLSTCTCPSWFKHYICKHIIGIAYRERLFDEIPKESWCLTLGQVASAERPRKMAKVLAK
ncbi:hypothetical protein BpHYR1_010387 [Brachionus plicatilis]|uniref:SWIM-type domain-containing protein n=1 Tax=Brachionus plicatilis TaxID=10195 RepID=A0A3M7SWB1_BRAPC|nr:hypothetical protein BpHYR1_010387 [Brachionus plicatilis]